MITVLLAMLIFVLAAAGLGIGIMFNRRPIDGSCGRCATCLCNKDRT